MALAGTFQRATMTLVLATVLGCVIPAVNLSLHDHEFLPLTGLSYETNIIHIDKDTDNGEHFSTASFSDNAFVIFGQINFHLSESWRKICALELYVEIGDNVWRQPLDTPVPFYAFQVPIEHLNSQRIGLFCVQSSSDPRCSRSLWRRFFLVQDGGGQQIDVDIPSAAVTLHCSQMPDYPATRDHIDEIPTNGGPGPVMLMPLASFSSNFHSFRYLSCPALQEEICPACFLPGSFFQRSATQQRSEAWWNCKQDGGDAKDVYTGLLQVAKADNFWDTQSLSYDDARDDALRKFIMDRYRWQLLLSFPAIRTRHILTFSVIFLVTRYLIHFLQSMEFTDLVERQDRKCRYDGGESKSGVAIESACSSISEQFSTWHIHTGGLWSRDSAGRLTRQSPLVQNDDDSSFIKISKGS